MGGSWSSDHDLIKSRVSTGDVEVISSDEVMVSVVLSQGLMDLKEGSSMNPKGELQENPKEELLGDLKGDFLPGLIQSEIQESYLKKLQSKYQFPLDFKLEVPLKIS